MACYDTHYFRLAEELFWYNEMLEARREWLGLMRENLSYDLAWDYK